MASSLPSHLPTDAIYADCCIEYERLLDKYNKGRPKSSNAIKIQMLLFIAQTLNKVGGYIKANREPQRSNAINVFKSLVLLLEELDVCGCLDITPEDIGEQGCWIPMERTMPTRLHDEDDGE